MKFGNEDLKFRFTVGMWKKLNGEKITKDSIEEDLRKEKKLIKIITTITGKTKEDVISAMDDMTNGEIIDEITNAIIESLPETERIQEQAKNQMIKEEMLNMMKSLDLNSYVKSVE